MVRCFLCSFSALGGHLWVACLLKNQVVVVLFLPFTGESTEGHTAQRKTAKKTVVIGRALSYDTTTDTIIIRQRQQRPPALGAHVAAATPCKTLNRKKGEPGSTTTVRRSSIFFVVLLFNFFSPQCVCFLFPPARHEVFFAPWERVRMKR